MRFNVQSSLVPPCGACGKPQSILIITAPREADTEDRMLVNVGIQVCRTAEREREGDSYVKLLKARLYKKSYNTDDIY